MACPDLSLPHFAFFGMGNRHIDCIKKVDGANIPFSCGGHGVKFLDCPFTY